MFPCISILPVPVMSLEFKSKLPPSCGVVSVTISVKLFDSNVVVLDAKLELVSVNAPLISVDI